MSQTKRKVVLNIACSLDGYIATEEDSLEWLFDVEGQEEANKGIEEFDQTVDTVIMGRRTFDWVMEELKGENPYKDKMTYVYSHSSKESSVNVRYTQEEPKQLIETIRAQTGKDIWLMGGGVVIRDFLEANLVDELIITIAPVLLGTGIPLFKNGHYHSKWILKGTRQVDQFAELHLMQK